MEPPLDTRGKSQLDRNRQPRDEEHLEQHGRKLVMVVEPGPVYGPWDLDADEAITKARQSESRRLHRRGTGGDERAGTASGTALAVTGAPAPGAGADERPVDRDLSRAGQPGDAQGPHGVAHGGRKLTQAQRRARVLTQRALSLRADGWEVRDIAAHLGVAITTITGWFTTHRRDVSIESINETLDQIAVPLAAENLIHGLLAGDKDYTLETLKGRGQLRRHGESDAKPQTTLPELRIVFEALGGSAVPTDLVGGKVIGVAAIPKTIDGVVVKSEPIEPSDETPGFGQPSVPHVPRLAPSPASPGDGGEVPAK